VRELQNNIYAGFFNFFGLRENPFTASPDPRYLFLTPQIQETWEGLSHGIQTRKGIIVLTGELGTGKTTVIHRLLDWLHQRHTPTAFIFNSHLEISHLFDFMLADFGVPLDPPLNGSQSMRLNQWLIERYRAGETPVLIVDEAQGLPIHVLEEIRLLLNLEMGNEKLLQILLAGQPELDEKLKRPELRQLTQRIALRCKTSALTREETHDYIKTRLQIAGSKGKQIFSLQAIDAVHFYSRGIPRVINLFCEHAIINAYADDVHLVPAQMVEEVAVEFQFAEKSLAPSLNFVSDRTSPSIAEQSVIPEAPAPVSRETAPHLTEKPDAVVTLASVPLIDASPTAELSDQHRFSLQDSKVPALHSHSVNISSAPIRRMIECDGRNKDANRVSESKTVSGRQLIAGPAASKPPIARSSVIRSVEVRKDSNFRESSHHFWAHWFDKRAFRRRVIEVTSRLVCSARRISAVFLIPTFGSRRSARRDTRHNWQRMTSYLVRWLQQPLVQQHLSNAWVHNSPPQALWVAIKFLRPTFGSRGSMKRDAGRVWQQMKRSLVQWLQQPMVLKQRSNARVHNPPPTVVKVAITFLRQLPRSGYGLRNNFLSIIPRASFHSLKVPLLRWLRQPIRPFRIPQSGSR
jgi:general secretion pathway protein A